MNLITVIKIFNLMRKCVRGVATCFQAIVATLVTNGVNVYGL